MDHGESDTVWAPATPAPDEPSALLPGYRDFHLTARGGDSIVYRAHQDALDRDVAIKVVQLDDDESISRFHRELAITVRLGRQHPHIMTVLATGTTTSGQPCLVMDHFELGSLHDRLSERGPLPVSEVVAAGSVIADALAFAHTQGVLHRDVKPQNVLVLPTSWVLADFGLARAIDAGHSSSLERFSYRHASPQVLDGEPPTVADDIYSLGSTLFTLLDGRAPYAADDPDEDSALSYLRRARTETPRSITRDDVPLQLAGIVRRCLARDPAQRFPDASALRDALDAVPTETRSWAPEPAPQPAPELAPPPPPDPVSDDAWFAPPPPEHAVAPIPAPIPAPVVEPAPEPAPPPTAEAAPPLAAPIPSVPVPSVPVSSVPLPPDPVAAADPVADPVVAHEPRVDSRPSGPFAPLPTPPAAEIEPDRPAVSALAQLPDHARTPRDADDTGLRPTDPDANPGPPTPAQDAPGTPGRRRLAVIGAAGVVALIAGIGVGFWRSGGDEAPTASGSATSSAPSSPAATSGTPTARSIPVVVTPTSPSPTAKGRFIRAADPRITSFSRSVSKSVVLSWTDPSKGRRGFVIFVTTGGGKPTTSDADPGQTTAIIPDVATGRHCFQVGVLTPSGATTTNITLGPAVCKTV